MVQGEVGNLFIYLLYLKKMISKLIRVVDHPRKKNCLPLKKKKNEHLKQTFVPIKNKIWLLQYFGLLKIEPKNCEKSYIHNIFITNPKL